MALSLVAVAGCGGDGGDADGTARLTKAEFIEKANAACRRERADLEEEVKLFLERRDRDEPRPVLYAAVAHRVLLPAIERQIEAVRAVGPPPREKDRIDEMLSAERLTIDILANRERIPSRAAVEREFAESGRALRAYGLSACANGPQSRRGA